MVVKLTLHEGFNHQVGPHPQPLPCTPALSARPPALSAALSALSARSAALSARPAALSARPAAQSARPAGLPPFLPAYRFRRCSLFCQLCCSFARQLMLALTSSRPITKVKRMMGALGGYSLCSNCGLPSMVMAPINRSRG